MGLRQGVVYPGRPYGPVFTQPRFATLSFARLARHPDFQTLEIISIAEHPRRPNRGWVATDVYAFPTRQQTKSYRPCMTSMSFPILEQLHLGPETMTFIGVIIILTAIFHARFNARSVAVGPTNLYQEHYIQFLKWLKSSR
jgi:hypothetical protein